MLYDNSVRQRVNITVIITISNYTVSQKKTSKVIFVITTSNFHQIWQLLAQRWQIV